MVKNLTLILISLFLFSCSKTKENKEVEEVIEFDMGTGIEVFVGTGEYGEVPASKTLTFAFTKKINTEVTLGGIPELENNNFTISSKTGVCNGTPMSSSQNCSVKVSFNSSGKASGLYESVLQFGNVFVNLSAIVPPKEVVADIQVLFNKAVIESYNFGQEITSNVMTTLTIKNNGSDLAEIPQVSGAGYSIISSNCPVIGLAKKKDCSVKILFNPKGLEGENLGTLSFGSSLSFPLIAQTPIQQEDNNPIKFYEGSILESNLITTYNFGDVFPGIKLPSSSPYITIFLYNQSDKSVIFPSSDGEMIELDGIKVLFNSCKNITLDKGKNCNIRLTYTPPYEVGENNGTVHYKESVLELKSNIISENKQLQNVNPISGILNFGEIQRNSGLSQILKMRIRNTTGSPQLFTEAPVLTNYNVVANTCLNNLLANNAYCEISVQFDSQGKSLQPYHETLTISNSLSFIEFQLQSLVIQNENIMLCTMDLLSETDIDNSNGAVLSISGEYPISCEVSSCSPLYSISPDKKSCIPDLSPCSEADVVANGWTLGNHLSIEGTVIAGNIGQCKISTCSPFYNLSSVNKICEPQISACTQADAISNGVNIANALTYSGNVVAGDASACRIATCSGTFEPTENGLACENKAMSSLSFTIANKNNNGYIKDSFLNLNINAVNALEMKISSNNNCSGGTYEPFVSNKQYTIPSDRLNVANSSVSIQFKRNENVSNCIYTSGSIASFSSSNYTHDDIPPTLSIANFIDGEDVNLMNITFFGQCSTGTNVETGIQNEPLTLRSCSGNQYTSQSISLTENKIYTLYVKQTDLAGNIASASLNINKVPTPCSLANMSQGGISQSSPVVTAVSGTLPTCLISTCNFNYNLNSATNYCDLNIPETTTCTVTNGSGTRTWNHSTLSYGACSNLTCNSGFALNSAQTACVDESIAGVKLFLNKLSEPTVVIRDGVATIAGVYLNQIGQGSSNSNLATNKTILGTNIKAFARGTYNSASCVIRFDDKAYCWGTNYHGQIGVDTDSYYEYPIAVDTSGVLNNLAVKKITLGYNFTCVIAGNPGNTTSDYAYCWGTNEFGQLGNNSTLNSKLPVAVDRSGVLANKTIKDIQAASEHVCVLTNDNKIYCWGKNENRKIGIDITQTFSSVPVSIDDSNVSGALNEMNILSMSISDGGSCVNSNSKVYCWGRPSQNNVNLFIQDGGTNYKKIAVGGASFSYSFSYCLLRDNGSLNCSWKSYYNFNNSSVADVATGPDHICVIKNNNKVQCVGDNHVYQLGDGPYGGTWIESFFEPVFFNGSL